MVWGKGPIHFISYGYLVFPVPPIDKPVFSPIEWCWLPCQKSPDPICEGLFLRSWVYCIGPHIYLYVGATLFWSLWHCDKFWNHEVWGLQLRSSLARFFFFFWLFGVPWDSMWILGWFFFNSTKNYWDFVRDCIEFVIALKNIDNLKILALPTCEYGIVPPLIFSAMFYSFSLYKSFTSLIKLIPECFILLMLL